MQANTFGAYVLASVVRAFYCGMGRRGIERLETANFLVCANGGHALSRPKYYAERELAFAEIRGVLTGLSVAA